MIGVIASLVLSLTTRDYVLLSALLLPLISRRNRDYGLLAYFIYALYASQRITALNVYTYSDLVGASAAAVSLLLLLEDVLLPDFSMDRLELLSAIPVLIGVILPESLIAGGLFYLAVRLRPDRKTALGAVLPAAAFLLLGGGLSAPGSTASQVLVIGGFTLLITSVTVLRRNLKRVRMF